ncbi:MAG: D-alanyl-D-alanine carboxypeptidase family protein [Actinomycetota bacterium]
MRPRRQEALSGLLGFEVGQSTGGLLPGTTPHSGAITGPALPPGVTPSLVSWRGVILTPEAMASYQQAIQMLGQFVPAGGWRSQAVQAAAYQAYLSGQKQATVAPPGHSLHESGMAVDIDTGALGGAGSPTYERFAEIMESLGWHRWNPSGEPWHFSFRLTG